MMHRIMMRDQARRMGRGRDNNRGQGDNRGQSDNRMSDQHMFPPQMYSNEYGMGSRVFDGNTQNRYAPRGFDSRGGNNRAGDMPYANPDYARYGDNAMSGRRSDGNFYTAYPFELAGRFGKEPYYPMYDFSSGSSYLTEQELDEWAERLLHSIDEKYKDTLKQEHVVKEAEEVGIHFDQFTKKEFYVTVLMMYTDYCKTLGTANFDVYLKLAKDWLVDDDIAVQGGEKLAAYHDKIVLGM